MLYSTYIQQHTHSAHCTCISAGSDDLCGLICVFLLIDIGIGCILQSQWPGVPGTRAECTGRGKQYSSSVVAVIDCVAIRCELVLYSAELPVWEVSVDLVNTEQIFCTIVRVDFVEFFVPAGGIRVYFDILQL